MSTYDEVQALVKTAREGEKTERLKALSNLTLLGKPLDKQTQDLLQSVFILVGTDKSIDVSLLHSVATALAKYGDLQTLSVTELLWPRLIWWIEEVAVNPKSTGDKLDLGDLLASDALEGLSRFLQYKGKVTGDLIRIVGMPEQKGVTESFSEMQKQIYLGLLDDALTTIGALGDENGADFLKRWKDDGNLAATIALEHFGESYDIIRKARIEREKEARAKNVPSSKSGSCFVATAVYGNPNHPDVQLLRLYRDQYLLPSALGRAFVKTYYFCSPFLVSVVRPKLAKKVVHIVVIRPFLEHAKKHLHSV